jgi:hypothetical protein
MLDLPVFIILCGAAIVANCIAVPRLVAYSGFFRDIRTTRLSQLSALTKALTLSLGACAIGAYMAPRAGLSAPVLESIIRFDKPHLALFHQLWPAFVSAFFILLGLMLLQLLFGRRHVSAAHYFSMPLTAKVLAEGVVEEIVYRWGLMSALARIFTRELLTDPNEAMIAAIILAAVASSLVHIADLARVNFNRLSMAAVAIVLVHFWGALYYGWLFWQYGLTAAIICHVLVIFISVGVYRMLRLFDLREESARGF